VLHTHGRNGQYHPHLHVLATSGGYDGGSALGASSICPMTSCRTWQWHLLMMLRQTLRTGPSIG
jgi:hypothetical protein